MRNKPSAVVAGLLFHSRSRQRLREFTLLPAREPWLAPHSASASAFISMPSISVRLVQPRL